MRDHRWYDATGQRPLFPFGYGRSYQAFAVSGVTASSDLSYCNQSGNHFTVAPGSHTALVGTTSDDLGHTATFTVGR